MKNRYLWLISLFFSTLTINFFWLIASIENKCNMWTISNDLLLCNIISCILGTPLVFMFIKSIEIIDRIGRN